MKLYTVVLTAFFLCMISEALRNTVFWTSKLEQKVQEEFLSYSAKKFITQSFKNTCEGKGFENFEQWQNACKSLFNLDSIFYETDQDDSKLIHAQWKASDNLLKCNGEVYYKLHEENSL